MTRPPFPRAYGFILVTAAFFLLSWLGQGFTLWFVELKDAADHGQALQVSDFAWQYAADTLENWQSEALQLVWQALGLRVLLAWGSSQSREGDNRIEHKIDALCRRAGLDPAVLGVESDREH